MKALVVMEAQVGFLAAALLVLAEGVLPVGILKYYLHKLPTGFQEM